MADQSRNLLLTVATVLMIISFGKVACDQCLNSIENIVVYEGAENTILRCGLGPNGERWTVRPTSVASRESQITNFTGSVTPSYSGLYAINQSGLIIRNATIDPTGGPISTAGIYYVYLADGNKTALKLVVIRSGPTCFLTRSASEGTAITCTIIFSDHPVSPMNATISCTADGQVYTAAPTKTLIKPYLWNSTTVINISNSSAANYDCRATFTAPDNNKTSYLAGNHPNYTANVTVFETPITTALPTTTEVTTPFPTTTPTPAPTTTQTGTTQPTTTNTNTIPSLGASRPDTGATNLTPTTATQALYSTVTELANASEPSVSPTQTQVSSTSASTTNKPSTSADLKSTSAEILPMFVTTGSIDVGLLSAKVTLGTVLAALMAATAAIGGLFGFILCCPLFAATSKPAGHIVDEIQRLPRREWIPVSREIRRMEEYRVIPFYKQSFSRYPTPYDYRLPSQGRRVQRV